MEEKLEEEDGLDREAQGARFLNIAGSVALSNHAAKSKDAGACARRQCWRIHGRRRRKNKTANVMFSRRGDEQKKNTKRNAAVQVRLAVRGVSRLFFRPRGVDDQERARYGGRKGGGYFNTCNNTTYII